MDKRTRFLALVWMLAAAAPAGAVEAGAPAPEVAARRLDAPAETLSLRALRGKVVYVDFWASWCLPCRVSMPALDALYRRNRDRGFAVVGVNKDMEAGDAQRFMDHVKVSFPLVPDAGDAIAKAFDVKAMPSGYLLDRKGVVRYVHRGFTSQTATDLTGEVQKLLEEK